MIVKIMKSLIPFVWTFCCCFCCGRSISFCSQNVSRSIHCITFCCWIFPLSAFTVYFFSVPCQGKMLLPLPNLYFICPFLLSSHYNVDSFCTTTAFLSSSCRIEFFLTLRYRLFLLLIFLTPLLLMLFIYIRIFIAIKKNDSRRQTLSLGQATCSTKNTQTSLIQMRWYKRVARMSLETGSIATEVTNESLMNEAETECSRSNRGSPESTRVIKRSHTHSKALYTTLLILGTYLFCWMPAVVFLALTCVDGCPFPITGIPTLSRVLISFPCNSLVVLKAIVDPFIYTLRMKEVKDAIKRARGL